MTVKQDLIAAEAELEAKGWCQGTGAEPDGKVCVEGAVASVTLGNPHMWSLEQQDDGTWTGWDPTVGTEGTFVPVPDAGAQRYLAARGALSLELARSTGYLTPWKWNDAAGRTEEDAKQLFRDAIAAQDD